MRFPLLASLMLSLLVATSGCMVLDEMDAAAAKMPSSGKKKVEADPEDSKVAAAASAVRDNPLIQKSQQWWNEATSLAPTGLESAIVTCRLNGTTQFMSKDDCLARGGSPGRV